MEFDASQGTRFEIREIPPPLDKLLREIPAAGKPDVDGIVERFFPPPSRDPGEESLCGDWKAFVEPDLHETFHDARSVVEADLRGMAEEKGLCALTISRHHAMAWISALNQARIGLVTRHGIVVDESTPWPPTKVSTPQDWLKLQLGFYDRIQLWLVDVMDA